MNFKNILNFFNTLIIHYRKVDLKYKDIPYYKEGDIVKLFMEYQSIEKVFESIILKFEKDVAIDDEYLDGVFKEFKIDREEANKVLRQMSQPKEPSFSRQALMKKPSFSKKNLSDTDESKQAPNPIKTLETPNNRDSNLSNNHKHQHSQKSSSPIAAIIFLSILIISIVFFLQPSNNTPDSSLNDLSDGCSGLDRTGNYMDKVVSRIENQGCYISGYYFLGAGSYNITAICPDLDQVRGRIGAVDIGVIVNKKVVSNKVKKVYNKNEVNGWIKMGLDKGYINRNSKDIINWVKLLNGKDFEL